MRSHLLPRLALFGATITTLALTSAAHAQSFSDGDLYLVSAGLPGGPGILRIDPGTWAYQQIYQGPMASFGRATYDSFRDRIVGGPDAVGSGLTMVSASGTVTHITYPGTQDLRHAAATGDGRIFVAHGGPTPALAYFDASNVLHDLLTSDGSAIATIPATIAATYFDVPTASLIVAYSISGPMPNRIERLQISADDARVTQRTSVDFYQGGNFESVMGLSRGPGGSVFIKLDDNANALAGRMALLDPVTMTVSTFASSNYFGVAGEIAGCYSSVASRGVALDSLSDKLRLFAQGEAGAGSIVASGVSSNGSSGELAQLFEIFHAACPADFDGTGFVDTDDYDAFVAAFEAGDDAADFDGSGFVDTDDFDAFVTAFEAGC